MKSYDYLIVDFGLLGAVSDQQMTEQGKECLIVHKRSHIGENVCSEEI